MNTKTNNTKSFQKKPHKTKKNQHIFAVKIGVAKVDGATCLYWQES